MSDVGEALGARHMAGFKDFFQYASSTRVVAGRDLLSGTGFEMGKEGSHRVWVVTDKVIRETGLVDRVEAGVADGGLEVAGVFDDVPQDSSTDVVDRCAAEAREAGADSFLAVGGGSVLDTAKIADTVFSQGGNAAEKEGFFLMDREDDGMGAPLPIAPLGGIPTTAGTGSEVSMGAIVKDPERKVKLEIADFPLFPRLAILDPEATRTLPPKIAAATGMDALTHAIESYVALEWNPFQESRSLGALRLIRENLRRAVEDGPSDEEARGNMLVAASMAIAIELGSAHAMSHPCGAQFAVPHGVANAINLPHVIRFNAEAGDDVADRYRDVCEALGVESGGSAATVGDNLASHVTGLVEGLGLPTRLSQVGVPEDGIPALVEGAMGDGLSLMNPREPSEEDYERLYHAAL
ncbi:MAG TPA: iron-containing alcohol dehydrogenase [Thermoleophilaceae bacterium]|nr:iron-containing alcohol dehydrogenase [Thermoleophilaceae bacterium]